jgi:hypothetical protein
MSADKIAAFGLYLINHISTLLDQGFGEPSHISL